MGPRWSPHGRSGPAAGSGVRLRHRHPRRSVVQGPGGGGDAGGSRASGRAHAATRSADPRSDRPVAPTRRAMLRRPLGHRAATVDHPLRTSGETRPSLGPDSQAKGVDRACGTGGFVDEGGVRNRERLVPVRDRDVCLHDGREAYGRNEWAAARSALLDADGQEPLEADDLELLAWSCRWQGDDVGFLNALERAEVAFGSAGRRARAAAHGSGAGAPARADARRVGGGGVLLPGRGAARGRARVARARGRRCGCSPSPSWRRARSKQRRRRSRRHGRSLVGWPAPAWRRWRCRGWRTWR